MDSQGAARCLEAIQSFVRVPRLVNEATDCPERVRCKAYRMRIGYKASSTVDSTGLGHIDVEAD